MNKELRVSPLQYSIQSGIQSNGITDTQLKDGDSFQLQDIGTETHAASILSKVKYDLLGKIAENVHLTRSTIASIIGKLEKAIFGQFSQNPEHFIPKHHGL